MTGARQKPEGMRPIPEIYKPCCVDFGCKGFQRTIELLKIWGFDTTIHGSGHAQHFKLMIPDYWDDYRRERFAAALSLLAQRRKFDHTGTQS